MLERVLLKLLLVPTAVINWSSQTLVHRWVWHLLFLPGPRPRFRFSLLGLDHWGLAQRLAKVILRIPLRRLVVPQPSIIEFLLLEAERLSLIWRIKAIAILI